ncbi:hypothetical protein V2W45_1465764 [Cenococcum geophilum]
MYSLIAFSFHFEVRVYDTQHYNIRHVYVDRIQGRIPFREASQYFFRGHHLYDENFYPIEPIQYHGRGALRFKPSTNPNHPPYPTTTNGGLHDSDHYLGEAQGIERARVAFAEDAEDAETPITSNTPYRTPSLPLSRSTPFLVPVTVYGSHDPSIVSTHCSGGPRGPLMDEWRTGETQQLMQQVRGELGWVENTPAVAVEGPGNRFIIGGASLMKRPNVRPVAVGSIMGTRTWVRANGEASSFG